MKKICCYGGAFDPVHQGHVYFAKAIIKSLQPDKLFFIPAALSPFKHEKGHAAPEKRLKMLELASRSLPRTAVLDLEIGRGGKSYTIDTLRTLKQKYPDSKLYWIIGDDHLEQLERWHEYPEHFSYADFIVLPRTLSLQEIKDNINKQEHSAHFHILKADAYPLSSTLIRDRIRRGESCDKELPKAVAQYIREEQLYRETP